MSLVNHRFHGLVTTPHAWRIAFSRYFPGPAALTSPTDVEANEDWEHFLLKRRAFSRLIALTSWRSEYILRTKLLRSLARGKPIDYQPPGQRNLSRPGPIPTSHPVVTYGSLLLCPVTHLDGIFGSSLENKHPVFVHGACEQGAATLSDPTSGKAGIGGWGVSDPQMFNHFADLFPGDEQWGLGFGNLVGVPNVMDVSQLYGTVYGEGCPQGRTYFLSSNEKRGRFLVGSVATPEPKLGIPAVNSITTGVCSVWIAKSPAMLKMTDGLFGMLSGSSSGILTAYALGPNSSYDKRFERGQITARWVLSPGVPIIAIKVDDDYSAKRCSQNRVWVVVMNALGEIFYLADIPQMQEVNSRLGVEDLERLAWATGRTARWELVEATRRIAQPDPFNSLLVDGSYSPRSSSNFMDLDENQIAAETREVESFLAFKPKHFRKVCQGWNMRRNLEVDFAGDDNHGAGETILIIDRGVGEGQSPSLKRLTRLNFGDSIPLTTNESYPDIKSSAAQPSIFGGSPNKQANGTMDSIYTSNKNSAAMPPEHWVPRTEWRTSDFVFDQPKFGHITTSSIDMSTFSRLTMCEDPLLGMGGSIASSEASSPLSAASQPSSPDDVPGQRGRFVAVGTSRGSLFVWNIRATISQNVELINKVTPVCIIHTESPRISSLAVSALYLVHGGNDGLVQAWDPLGSTMQPIRTLNSRFSSRARRRLMQAEASVQGVGHNYFAAGAILLDPDPTRIRGLVALGTQLRYWAYSSSAADQYKSHKRRTRYGKRGFNSSPENQRLSGTGRGALKDYIMNEKLEMVREQVALEKERALLSGRFGVDLLGADASEDDLLAYACMLSEESYTSDEKKPTEGSSRVDSRSSDDTIAPPDFPGASFSQDYPSTPPQLDTVEEEQDPEIAEAIRRSLQESNSIQEDVFWNPPSSHQATDPNMSPDTAAEGSRGQEIDDLDFAIQLSLAEGRSQADPALAEVEVEEFPALSSPHKREGKGKGKERASP